MLVFKKYYYFDDNILRLSFPCALKIAEASLKKTKTNNSLRSICLYIQ